MVGSGPHQKTPNRPEPAKSRHQGNYGDPGGGQNDNERFREGSVHTSTVGGSQTRRDGHVPQKRDDGQAARSQEAHSHTSQRRDDKVAMQREIDDLKRKLRRAQRRRSEPNPDPLSDDESDDEYRQRSRTPPSETFSHEEERYQRRRRANPTPRGLGGDAMSKALDQLSKSPFTRRIEEAELPRRFQQPTFIAYNGKTDPVEHVSQFNQRMAVHSKNEALMCKVFPSSLGPVAMRWFNGLRTSSIDSYRQLTQAFGSRFVTNSRPPRPMSALLSLSMRDGETLKAYSDKYWEIYNDLDGKYDAVAINTF